MYSSTRLFQCSHSPVFNRKNYFKILSTWLTRNRWYNSQARPFCKRLNRSAKLSLRRNPPASLTRNSKMVSFDPSAIEGKFNSELCLVNSSIFARSSSSNTAPILHMTQKMYSRSSWEADTLDPSSFLGISPSRIAMACKWKDKNNVRWKNTWLCTA